MIRRRLKKLTFVYIYKIPNAGVCEKGTTWTGHMETGVTSLAFFSTGENVCFSADSDKNNAQKEFRLCRSSKSFVCILSFLHLPTATSNPVQSYNITLVLKHTLMVLIKAVLLIEMAPVYHRKVSRLGTSIRIQSELN